MSVDIITVETFRQFPGRVVEKIAAGLHHVVVVAQGLAIDCNDKIGPAAPAEIALFADPHLIPGRQPLDVGREDVFRADWNAEAIDNFGKKVIGAGRAGTVYVGKADNEIVYSLKSFHLSPAFADLYTYLIISQAAVGQRSAQMPQCRQTFSSLTMTRPVGRVSET